MLEKQGAAWLEKETVKLQLLDGRFFYIHLSRSYPERMELKLDKHSSKRAYQRLSRLLVLLNKKDHLLSEKIYQCFDAVSADVTDKFGQHKNGDALFDGVDIGNVQAVHFNERLLKPLMDWVDDVYFEYRNIPLVQTRYCPSKVKGEYSEQLVNYSNLFFFMRVNVNLSVR